MKELQTIPTLRQERGCGYPQIGGTYLFGGIGISLVCDRLPLEIGVCNCCGETIRFFRGIQQINPLALWGVHDGSECTCPPICPLCHPEKHEAPCFFMWVGQDYSMKSFAKEAFEMGVSKRISVIPKDLEIGKSWIFLGKTGIITETDLGYDAKKGKTIKANGVFYAFKVTQIQYWIAESDATEEKLKELKDRGITPVIVPETPENQCHFGKTLKRKSKKAKQSESLIPLDQFGNEEE